MRLQRLGQVGPGTAAGVEDIYVLRRQPIGDTQVVLQGAVHPGHHVADYLGGGVPDTQLLAQGRVEGLQEGLVEVGHRLPLVEPCEEGVPIYPVQRRGGPVQHLHQSQGVQLDGGG